MSYGIRLNGEKIGYNFMLDQWEDMWINGVKFSLNYNLKEFF